VKAWKRLYLSSSYSGAQKIATARCSHGSGYAESWKSQSYGQVQAEFITAAAATGKLLSHQAPSTPPLAQVM